MIVVVIASVLMIYAVFMVRSELHLENFVRSPTVKVIANFLRKTKPACVVHDYEEIRIFCVDCAKEGCHSCWGWVLE